MTDPASPPSNPGPFRNPWEGTSSERELFRATFDEDPDAYDRSRPVSPPQVFDDAVAIAGLGPGSRVLEINAFHWLEPGVQFAKPAGLLRPGGHLIVLATPWVRPDGGDRFWWDNQEDWVAVGEAQLGPIDCHPDRMTDISGPLSASGYFATPTCRRYRFDVDLSAAGYLANLSTQSVFKRLSPAMQRELTTRLRRRIQARGGTVQGHFLATLVIARLRPLPR